MAASLPSASRPRMRIGSQASSWRPPCLHSTRWDGDEASRIDAETHYVAQAWNTAAGLLATFNTLDDLPHIETPTLCVGGAHDFITPPEPGAARMVDLLPNAEMSVFDASGHYPFIEERESFFTRLREFLDRAS